MNPSAIIDLVNVALRDLGIIAAALLSVYLGLIIAKRILIRFASVNEPRSASQLRYEFNAYRNMRRNGMSDAQAHEILYRRRSRK